MKRIMLSTKIACGAFILAAATFASCSDSIVGGAEDATDGATDATIGLTTVKLATFAGDQSRVTYAATRGAEGEDGSIEEKTTTTEPLAPGTLKLFASIANPSKEILSNYVEKDEYGQATTTEKKRYISATSVFYDANSETYYATYHMQGNNYNTTLDNEIGGAIQCFKVNGENDVEIGTGYRTADANLLDFDFNHIYFDNAETPARIIAVGHDWKVPAKWDGKSRENTHAIIGKFDPLNSTFTYKSITTADKLLDENDKSLGDEDAGDANCVVRVMNYPNYYVTTRKGIAVLRADQEHLFQPQLNEDGSKYFVKTPGSAKFVFDNPEVGSGMDILYLSENKPNNAYIQTSKANIAQFQVATLGENNSFYSLINPKNKGEEFINSDFDILNYTNQTELPEVISPIDGKNAIFALSYGEHYVALGTSGLYYKFYGKLNQNNIYEGVIPFGGRPVNCVYVDMNEDDEGIGEGYDRTSHDGFIYVANGARLTILHRRTLEEVASWNIPTKNDKGDYLDDVAASANYITVTKSPKGENGLCERTITVAFGQEGLKVFKFMPTTKTVWE